MGPSAITASTYEEGQLATTLAGVRILFDGTAAPLLYVSATQSGAVVPYSVSDKETVTVQVEYQGVSSDPLVIPVFALRPAVFTKDGLGRGQGLILNEDGSLNSPDNPGQRGTVFTMFMTGLGLTTPPVSDGAIVGSTVPKPRTPVILSFADPSDPYGDRFLQAENVSSAGIPGTVNGLFGLQFRIPQEALTGTAVPITFWQNGQIDQVLYGDSAVTLALR
jgi:trimeric autotransporter adhesin